MHMHRHERKGRRAFLLAIFSAVALAVHASRVPGGGGTGGGIPPANLSTKPPPAP
jgi:hypothetical protein